MSGQLLQVQPFYNERIQEFSGSTLNTYNWQITGNRAYIYVIRQKETNQLSNVLQERSLRY